MGNELYNVALVVIIALVLFFLYRRMPSLREGMQDASGNTIISSSNGIAGNSASYGATLKAETIRMRDEFLMDRSEYKTAYESIILSADDLVNNLMLKTVLTMDVANPMQSIERLGKLQSAKTALNSVMKYVDSS